MVRIKASGDSERWAVPFFTIWGLQALSFLGSMLVQFALIWWLTETTGSATVLATATMMWVLPQVLLGPFAGAYVDRWNRRLVMIVADGTVALATVVLALVHAGGALAPWHIYAVMFVRATAGGFHWNAMTSSTSLMVPKDQLSRVAGMNQTLQGAVNIVTPPLGAVLLGVLPLYGILSIDVVTALLAIAPLFFVSIPRPERAEEPKAAEGGRSVLHDMKEGLQYLAAWPAILVVLAASAVINALLSPAFSLLPLMVTQHFGGGAMELGWLNSASGIGVLAGGLLLSVWGGFKKKLETMFLGLGGLTLGALLLGLSPVNGLTMGLAAMFVFGLGLPMSNGPFFALLQERLDPSYQGRVFSLVGAVCQGAAPLGLIVAGPVADRFGVQTWFLVAGLGMALIALTMRLVPSLWRIEDGPRDAAADAVAEPSTAALRSASSQAD